MNNTCIKVGESKPQGALAHFSDISQLIQESRKVGSLGLVGRCQSSLSSTESKTSAQLCPHPVPTVLASRSILLNIFDIMNNISIVSAAWASANLILTPTVLKCLFRKGPRQASNLPPGLSSSSNNFHSLPNLNFARKADFPQLHQNLFRLYPKLQI